MASKLVKLCERCNTKQAVRGNRYCKECRKIVLDEMKKVGYLKPKPSGRNYRSTEKREDIRETKDGIDL